MGDILIIRDDETVPADCVLLRTKKHCNGTCWVETSNLDGEKNLKPKLSSKYIENHFREIFLNQTIDFIGRFIEPSKDMYFYDGLITLQFSKTVIKQVEINLNTFLHRGAVLRNSGEVLALVTQTGVQTKVLMNLGSYKAKISRLEKSLNFFMMFNVLLMLTLALTLTYRNFWFNKVNFDRHLYIFKDSPLSRLELTQSAGFSFYLIMNQYVPMDLVIALELIKIVSTAFMEADADMKHLQTIEICEDRKAY